MTQLVLFHTSLLLNDTDIPSLLTNADNPSPSVVAINSIEFEM